MGPESNLSPVIVGQGGPLNGYRWDLEDELLIGRAESCDITISSQQVSRRHTRVFLSADLAYAEDLNSKNGSYHNGIPITERVQLRDGDVLQIALAQEFIFLSQDATVPLDASDFQGTSISLFPQLALDPGSRKVTIGDSEIAPPLSALQFKLLAYLYEQDGAVASREEIIKNVWGDPASQGVTDQALDALIRRLRDRLAEISPGQEFIVTVRGQGFRLDHYS